MTMAPACPIFLPGGAAPPALLKAGYPAEELAKTFKPSEMEHLRFVLYGHKDDLTSAVMTAKCEYVCTTSQDNSAIIWRLDDADALLSSSASKDLGRIAPLSEKGMVEELFGATGIGSMRPEQYSQSRQSPASPG